VSSIVHKKQPRDQSSSLDFFKGVGKVTGGTLLGITMLASAIVAGGLVGLAISFRNLPDVRILRNYFPSETSYIYDIKGKLLASVHGEANREVVPLDKISPDLKRAVWRSKIATFMIIHGINLTSVGRALLVNWQRGSTSKAARLSRMQLVKIYFSLKSVSLAARWQKRYWQSA
jgi:penicillin-binding protein 1A